MSLTIAPDFMRQPGRGKFTECALTPAQDKLWAETRARFLFSCPAFSHILYELMLFGPKKDLALFTKDIKMDMPDGETYYPPAATDGAHLIINPDEFFKFNAPERVFIVAHEVLHCVFNHMAFAYAFRLRGKVSYADGTELPYSSEVMNIAEDLVINDILIESRVGAMPKRDGQQFGCWDTRLGKASETALDVYRRIFDRVTKAGGGAGMGMVSFDAHLDPGSANGTPTASQAAQARSDASWKTGVAQALAIGRAQGDQAAALERVFGDVLDPKVDWREHIKSLFARKVGNGGFDWRRADRRLIARSGDLGEPVFAPGRSGHGVDTVVIGVDTSGSIGSRELDMFFSEMGGILEDLRPKRLIVMWCDAEVHRVDEVEDAGDLTALRAKGAPGGGGTSFIPVFEEIRKMGLEKCDAVVYLTDGYGSFPAQPDYPVIWGNIAGNNSRYPWGDVVDITVNT